MLGCSLVEPPVAWAERHSDPVATTKVYKGVPVSGYRIVGLDGALARGLVHGLALQGRQRFLRRQHPAFDPKLLEDDLRRTALFLGRRGYPFARVNPRVEPSAQGTSISIILDVEPGPSVSVGELVFVGFPIADEELKKNAGIETGMRFSDALVDTASTILQGRLHAQGYAFATVRAAIESMDSTRVRVRYVAAPGLAYRFGRLFVEGTREDLAGLVEKTVVLRKDTPYSPRTVQRIEERIRMLELFRRVQVGLEPRVDSVGIADLRLRLAGLDPRTIEAGIGLQTDEGVLARAGWQHRNLLGGGRGGLVRFLYSRHLRTATGALWFPGLLRSDLRQEVRLVGEWQREESYDLDKYQLELAGTYHRSFRSSAQAGVKAYLVSFREISVDDSGAQVSDEVLSLAFARVSIDASDNRLDPRRGHVSTIRAESTIPRVRSDIRFSVVEASLAVYRPVLGSTFAVKALAGRAWPLNGAIELPPDVRFYAGGATSMRGFGRRKLGPLDEEGRPLGGELLAEASLEIRIPVVRPLTVASFLDAGQVWRRATMARANQLEVAWGAGIRLATPIGPVRVDVARRLTDWVPDQPSTVYHLALGNPF